MIRVERFVLSTPCFCRICQLKLRGTGRAVNDQAGFLVTFMPPLPKLILLHMKSPVLTALTALCLVAQAQVPTNIEAVEYDPNGDRWFVSNGSSLLVTSDQGATWDVFGEAQASHGMEVMDDRLFAIGNDVIRAYDLGNASLLDTLAIPGVSFLNGMGSDGDGRLIVSDFGSGRIYSIDASNPEDMTHFLLAGNFGEIPNGVVVDAENNRAIVVCWGGNADILAIDLESGDVSTLVNETGLTNLDGIDDDGNGAFYVSSWSPTRITRFTNNFSAVETVVSGSGLSNPADISYAQQLDVLGVANSGSDVVTWHDFAGVSSLGVDESADIRVQLRGPWLCVDLPHGEKVQWSILDAAGRVVRNGSKLLDSGSSRWQVDLPSAGLIVVSTPSWSRVVR